jgi:chemosensory pili system protein ChpA (sensor histidine kinase/response regulator)
MQPIPAFHYWRNGLGWVKPEIALALQRVRNYVEQHLEEPEDTSLLPKAAQEVQALAGVTRMIHAWGGFALCHSMYRALHALIHDAPPEPEAALAAVISGSWQLVDYLELLQQGQSDHAVILAPIINELRLARGATIQTEADLVIWQLQESGFQVAIPEQPPRLAGAAQVVAKKILPPFQALLLQWLRGVDVDDTLQKLSRIAYQIGNNAIQWRLYVTWTAYGALTESLVGQVPEDSLELKRLFGRMGLQIKQLADAGELDADSKATDLPALVLFHLRRLPQLSERGQRFAHLLDLPALLPNVGELQQARLRLRAPNTSLLSHVAAEIHQELGQVKDAIDLSVRTGVNTDLVSISSRIQRIGQTLTLLGLPVLTQILQQQVHVLSALSPEQPISTGMWMNIATVLLRVEHSLDASLSQAPQEAGETLDAAIETLSSDQTQARSAVVRECLVNLANIKTAIESYFKTQQESLLNEVCGWLRDIAAVLTVLDLPEAADVIHHFAQYSRSDVLRHLAGEELMAYARSLISAEIYFETLRDRPVNIGLALADLQQCGYGLLIPEVSEDPIEVESETVPAALAAPSHAVPPDEDVDPEILEIFLEEAEEVIQELQRHLPGFARQPTQREILADIRRAFHTLKGSGRMVKAMALSEFSLSLEQMLHRCLEGALATGKPVVETVQQAVGALPALLEAFRQNTPVPSEAKPISERAQLLTSGHSPELVEAEALAIFHDDAVQRLAALQAWWDKQGSEANQFSPDRELSALCHTLKGAAGVVNAHAIAKVAGQLEIYLDAVRLSQTPLPLAAADLFKDCIEAMRAWLDCLGQLQINPELPPYLRRIEQAILLVPRPMARAQDKPLFDDFAVVAFEHLQSLEEHLQDWSQQPEPSLQSEPVAPLRATLSKLQAAAVQAECATVTAFTERYSQTLVGGAATLPRSFFVGSLELVERLYQFLDHYREDGLDDEGASFVQAIENLPPAVLVVPAVPAVPAQIVAPESFDWQGLLNPAPAPAPTEVVEAAEVAKVVIPQPEITEVTVEPLILEGQSFPPVGLSLDNLLGVAPPIPVPVPAVLPAPEAHSEDLSEDQELREIFLAEAEEVLETIRSAVARLQAGQIDHETVSEVRRGWHTLKGSSRMTGFNDIGEVSHALENATREAERDPSLLNAGLYFRYLLSADAVENMLKEGKTQHAALAAELRNRWQQEATPEVTPEVILEVVAPDPLPEPAPIEPASPSVAVADLDMDLVEMFESEAGELLESLEGHFAEWQQDPANPQPLRLILQDLHTLKGGARMSGMMAIGSYTHHFESQVNRFRVVDAPIEAQQIEDLLPALEHLHGMHDQLRRGDYAPLTVGEVPEDEPVELPPDLPVEVSTAPPIEAPPAQLEPLAETVAVSLPPPAEAITLTPEPVLEFTPEPLPEPVAEPAPAPVAASWDQALFWKPAQPARSTAGNQRELARVPVDALDDMLNLAGEISIFRSRLEQQNTVLLLQLKEMTQTIVRIREQLRMVEMETDAQIAARGKSSQAVPDLYDADFDPLEMDRYSRMQELSRALAESVSDLNSIQDTMSLALADTDALLQQQSVVNTQIQQGLMGTLMVPFNRQVSRLTRVVRQTAQENGKLVEIHFSGDEAELDRNVLERMTAPLEHLLRNAVIHGLELPDERLSKGKQMAGQIRLTLRREGNQLLVELQDDGRGLDFLAIRQKAVERGLMPANSALSDEEVAQFIFEPGFSTARKLTQDAGRGVGMDVVSTEVKQLGGNLEMSSVFGEGTRFLVRLPLTLAISHALLVRVGEESYAIPLGAIEGIARIPRDRLHELLADNAPLFAYAGQEYRVMMLHDLLQAPPSTEERPKMAAVLVSLGEGLGQRERRVAVIVDDIDGNREIVSKNAGTLVGSISGLAGATILADGRVVMMLDMPALVYDRARRALRAQAAVQVPVVDAPLDHDQDRPILVVDDSITMRRVAERLLSKQGFTVATAKDGLDAIAWLQTDIPATILLDIEMPRADGFEVAAFVRNNERLKEVPIIMITSRSGDKHRERARSLGVNRYLIKPYQEDQLLNEVRSVKKGVVDIDLEGVT